jgi:serine/threonine protein kinase
MTLLAGRYRLGRPIARGGMAVVHHADDSVLRRPVAVKTLAPDRAADAAYRSAVRREAVTAARLLHPNIPRILDYGESEWYHLRLPFLVMELVPGRTLAAHLDEHGALPWPEAARICAGVAAALSAAHRRGVVHHDVKPANIMVTGSGVKVVDFGVAGTPGENPTDTDGRVWGTPAYFAPEQLCGQPTDTGTDIYSLGLVLHTCLTGRPVWPGRTSDDVLIARACNPVPQLPRPDELPDPILRIHRACLARSPRRRPSADHLVRSLTEALRRGHANGRPRRRCRSTRR